MGNLVPKHISTNQAYILLCCTILITITLSLTPFPVQGEIQAITRTVKEPFGGSRSADDARIAAVAKAKREALEMAGVYVEGLTVVKNSRVDKDEILALTAGVLKTEVISQENYATKDAFGVEIVVRIDVDTSVLEDRVKKLLADRTHLEQLNKARKKEKELLDTVAKLQDENARLTKGKKSTKQLKNQFQKASRGLKAVDWFDKAIALWQGGRYTDPKKAVECLNNTIRLKPDDADAYNNRGAAYTNLNQHQRAIEDYNEAIHIKPDDAKSYYNRAIAFNKLGQHQQAIEDFNTAIRLKPDYAKAYNNRGIAYNKLGQYERAIEDFNTAIRLKPDLADTYYNRGIVYFLIQNNTGGCKDAQKACGMGSCKLYELVKKKGLCR